MITISVFLRVPPLGSGEYLATTSLKSFMDLASKFSAMLDAYHRDDSVSFDALKAAFLARGDLSIETSQKVDWGDPFRGWSAPTVVQAFRVVASGEILHSGERWFGSELFGGGHLGGLTGEWTVIRVDDAQDRAELPLEELGMEIPDPHVPEWRRVDEA